MTDANPIMALMLASGSFVGPAVDAEEEIQPIPAQLNFTTGDTAILAAANTPLEKDFAFLRAVDPTEYTDTFPDWEERLLGTAGTGWNSHVLCEHFSRDDPEITLGWFSRVKILPIAKYRYAEAKRWLKTGFPDEIPDWAHKYHLKYVDQLSARAPDKVPHSVRCPRCGSTEVDLWVSRRVQYHGRAGRLSHKGKDVYVTIQDPTIDDGHVSQLRCQNPDCRTTASLEDEEWELPGITGPG